MNDPARVDISSELRRLGLEELAAPDVWSHLEGRLTVRSWARGAVLWTAGTSGGGMHIVRKGRIRVVRARRGRQHLVHVSHPGDTMGEIPIVDGAGYPATAIAAEASESWVVAPDDVLDLVRAADGFARFLLGRLARRVRTLVQRLEDQTLGDVRSRMASSLVGLSAEGGSTTVDLPSPQADWAEDLGTVRETLGREIARLVDDGVLERVGRGRVRIVDEVGLERIALRG